MQTPKSSSRASSSDPAQNVSPRQLRPKTLDCATTSSSNKARKLPNERSPKSLERRSPRSPLSEKKQPSRISELESHISKLLEDLNKAKEQSVLFESLTKQAEQDAEESKKQLSAMSAKLDELQMQILELSEFQKISEEDRTREAKSEPVCQQQSIDCVDLGSAMKAIQQLNARLELVAESGAVQTKQLESKKENLHLLNVNLEDILSFVKKFKNQSNDGKEIESSMEELLDEALLQLEDVKQTVEKLTSESMKAMDETNSISLELTSLKKFLDKVEVKFGENQETRDRNEIKSLKSEIEELKSAETKYHEEQIQSQVQIRTAYDLVEKIKSEMSLKEAVLEKELQKSKADIEDLMANLMDKETELQGISEENEELHSKLKQNESIDRESKLKKELMELKDCLADLKANYMDKETEFQCVSEENEMLTLEINRRKTAKGEGNESSIYVEAARAAEREALTKMQNMTEEADRKGRKAAKVAEELEIAQAENAELEAEMRRLKVQSDQWRKAAEAAAAMMSPGKNGNFINQSESLDGNYDSLVGRNSPHIDGFEDNLLAAMRLLITSNISFLSPPTREGVISSFTEGNHKSFPFSSSLGTYQQQIALAIARTYNPQS